jgi:hypothetical protein
MTAFQQRFGKPSQRRTTLLSWEKREFWCRNAKRSHRNGRPMSWTVRCIAVIFLLKTHQTNLYGNYQRNLEYRVRPCLTTYLLMKSGRPIYENELSDADIRRYEACAMLLEWIPTALSRGKFLCSDEWVVYLSSLIRNAVFGPVRILITRFTREATHTLDDMEKCHRKSYYLSELPVVFHTLTYTRIMLCQSWPATRCGFSKMALQLQLIHLYCGSVSEFLKEEFPDRWIFRGTTSQRHGLHVFPTWLHLITACGDNKKQSGSASLEHQRWIKPPLLMPSPL